MSDTAIIVCVTEEMGHPENSTLKKADLCEHEVWYSPSAKSLQETKNGQTICYECYGGRTQLELDGMLGHIKVTPQQIREMADALSPDRFVRMVFGLGLLGATIEEDE